MTKPADTTWRCPYCDYRVPYGAGCASGDLATCTLGTKNIHWRQRLDWQQKQQRPDGRSIGIAEIANDEEGM